MTESNRIECRLLLKSSDFIMQNHRVYGVSVLPGVTLLDVLYRILVARGLDARRAIFRNLLFPEAIATRDGLDRQIRVTLEEASGDLRPVRVESRWMERGEPRGSWRENLRAELSFSDQPEPPAIDLGALKSAAIERRDMEHLYVRARAEDIRHGPPMKCTGTIYVGEESLLAELRLDEATRAHADRFYLHPALLDASTIAACGRTEAAAREPFIPVFIERFRALRSPRGSCYAFAPRAEVLTPSGEVIHNDYLLCDGEGRPVAELGKLTCKRIRSPDLITRLVSEVASPPSPAGAAAGSPAPGADAAGTPDPTPDGSGFVRRLRELVARRLGRPAAEIRTDLGFYDLGLDSVAMLHVSQELEGVVGASLYPTLLFEFTDIDSLAAHLSARYGLGGTLRGAGAPAQETALAAGGSSVRPSAAGTPRPEASCYRPVWSAVPPAAAAAEGPDDIVCFTAGTELGRAVGRCLAGAGRRLVRVEPGTAVEAAGPDVYRLDVASREQVGRLLATLADDGVRPRCFVHFAPAVVGAPSPDEATGACLTAWSLAAALVDRKPDRSCALLFLHPAARGDGPPHLAAMAGLARTLSAETPLLRCRSIGIEAGMKADVVARVVLAEARDPSAESEVRYRDGERQVRRYAFCPPGGEVVEPPPRQRGVYLLTGGAGALAGILADHLAGSVSARLVLAGRRPLDRAIEERVRRLEERGAEVLYLQADVSRRADCDLAVARARERFGGLDGIFHCAGVIRDAVFFRKRAADLEEVLAPKVLGTLHLDAASRDEDLDFFVLFSSLAASLPNPGQCDYAYANAFLEGFAEWRARRADRRGRTLAVGWPLWAEGGMGVAPELLERARQRLGTRPLPSAEGLGLLWRALARSEPVVVVAYGERTRIEAALPQAPADSGRLPAAAMTPAAGDLTAQPAGRVAPRREGGAEEIAIIGLAGQYPQAPDLDAFWRNLAAGRDSIVEIPAQRWDHARFFDPEKGREGTTYSRWGGFLEGIDLFDPGFFSISRRDAERMDPQERLFLKTGWQTLEDAGYPPQSLAEETVGVFVGVMWSHYQLFDQGEGGVAPTALHAAVANRVSYSLDLKGPSLAVDTACSSSLTAVHLAVESLRRGDCTLALAGGVNATLHPQKYLQLAQGQFLATDGRCRSFGKGGSGYVPGEGVGAVLLKPLARARADGDHVYGVIRSSSLNHTGRTAGFTVPSPTSQAALIREAVRRAGISPQTIGYIEAHGTGTALGDPIEIEGLARAFAGDGLPAASCAIGSVKSNIGHLESAAGIAGLTKVLLQMEHRQLVPSLHASELNPEIDFASSPFYVQRELVPWPAPPDGSPRRAGISAFGAGGANAHILLESVEPAPAGPDWQGPSLFVLSARDEEALAAYARSFVSFLDRSRERDDGSAASRLQSSLAEQAADLLGVPAAVVDPQEPLSDLGFDRVSLAHLVQRCDSDPQAPPALGELTLESTLADVARRLGSTGGAPAPLSLDDLTYTLQVGRAAMAVRLAVVVRDLGELRSALKRFLAGGSPGPDDVWGAGGETAAGTPTLTGAECAARFRAGRLRQVAAHWVAGGDVSWNSCYPRPGAPRPPRRISLPTYPFREERCWIGRWKAGGRSAEEQAGPPAPRRPAPAPPAPSAAGGELPAEESVELRILDHGIALVIMGEGESNLFTARLLHGLESAFAKVGALPQVKAVVITGSGNVFSMGATSEALEKLAAKQGRFTDVPFLYEGLLRCDRPVVAAIQGHASGGGLLFGLHADLVVMSREGVYSANFMNYGFTPGMGATYILERRFGRALATEMLFTGKAFGGDELERRGAQVTFLPRSEVIPAALDLARAIADKPLAAVTALKSELAGRILERLPEIIAREVSLHEQVLGSESIERIQEHFGKVERFAGTAVELAPAEGRGASGGEPAIAAAASRGEGPAAPAVEPPGPGREEVLRVIEEALCVQLYVERQEIDRELTFNEMGLDSLGAVEIVRDLSRRFSVDLGSEAIYDHPTIPRLADFVLRSRAEARKLHAAAAPEARDSNGVGAGPAPGNAGAVKIALRSTVSASAPPSAAAEAGEADRPIWIALRPTPRPPAAPPPRRRPAATPEGGPGADGIAVIGMSGRFPGASDLGAFWDNLAAGRSSIREVPPERWEVARYFDPDRRAPGRTYSKWAALLSDVDRFDAAFFNLSPMEAQVMDPQQRLFLEQAWAGLEDAGYAGPAATGSRCGVFVGCGAGDYVHLLGEAGESGTGQVFLGNSTSILAARIAYFLDLHGPTLAVDTACSSSLVAVHLACESLRSGECEMALAGGVAVMVTPQMHIWTSKAGMLSPTGRCAPFDAAADGIVLGEGVGVVVLKRLAAALEDGDHICGVIAGSGINSDGKTNGITAPSAASQAELLARVYERAGVSPAEIGYVEAHGTATHLGDPIEVKALDQVFRRHTSQQGRCGIGSVKSNIGHTTMAAGIAGLLKVLLALQHRQLPPSLNFHTANPEIDLARSPFFVVSRLTDWQPGPAGARIGAVSSFGFSGTNCHLVVAEAPRRPEPETAPPASDPCYLVPVSARTEEALKRRLEQLADDLPPGEDLRDVAFTLSVGRAHFPMRAALVARHREELVRQLRALLAGGEAPGAFLSSTCDETTLASTGPAADGEALRRLAVAADAESFRAELESLAQGYVQGHDPAWTELYRTRSGRRTPLPIYPFAGDRHWVENPPPRSAPPRPDGHPLLGEPLPAAAAAGRRVFERELHPEEWVVADHRVQGRPVLPGAACLEMAAAAAAVYGLSPPLALSSVEWLRPFEVAQPRRVRFSLSGDGDRLAFELAGDGEGAACCARGVVSPLVGGGEVERLDLPAIAGRCPRRLSAREIYAGFDQAGLQYGPSFQVLEQVSFGEGEALGRLAPPAAGGELSCLTLHPGLVDGALQTVSVLATPSSQGPLVPFSLDSLELYGPLTAAELAHATRHDDHRFSVVLADAEGRVVARCRGFTLRPRKDPLERMIYLPTWRELAPSPELREGAGERRMVAVVYAPGARPLARALGDLHAADEVVETPLPQEPAAPARLEPPLDLLYFLACDDAPAAPPQEDPSAVALFRLVRRLIAAGQARRALTLKIVVGGAVAVSDEEPVRPHAAGLVGLSRTVAAELRRWSVNCIDVGAEAQPPGELARRVVREEPGGGLVALRGDRRLSRAFVPTRLPVPAAAGPFRRRGAYLIVGGAGGVGFALSRHLARTAGARLAWVGRSPATPELERKLSRIETLGGEAIYLRADVTDPAALRAAVTAAHQRLGPLSGAFHSALVLEDKTLANMDEAAFRAVLAPKVTGAAALAEALRGGEALDFLVFFSSAASFVDSGGQASYAAASTFEDAYALYLRRRCEFPVVVINWGFWGSVGVAAAADHRRRFAALGVGSIEPAEGMAALDRVLAAGIAQALVLKADPARLAEFGIHTLSGDQPTPAPEAPGAGGSPAGNEPGPAVPPGGGGALEKPVRAYLKRVFAEVLKSREVDLAEGETFENFGVDSLVGINILHRLEQDLGDLPSTLLFEHMTLAKLAAHLVEERGEKLAALLAPATGEPHHGAARTGEGEVEAPARGEAQVTTGDAHQLPDRPADVGAGDATREPVEIAVIGVSGRYPLAPDLTTFWRHLASGANCVTEVPAERWDWRAYFDPRRGRPNRSYGRWAGFIAGIDQFDAAFFNVLPRDARDIDPQERLFLETCWNLLEETGYLGEHTLEPETGVFAGVMYGSYGKLAAAVGWPRGELAGGRSDSWSIANRVSYFFDFQGPSFAVDSACSSSLTAVHLACEALRRRECRMAIAGGVNLILHPAHLVALSAMNLLASGPGCRPFDRGADGYVPGEGVGVVLLKPLDRALADRDFIWGVIKASSVNAGGKTSGYTVPNPNAQARLIGETLRRSGVDPRTITYVEAHGTGTELGDPIEVASLTRAFGRRPGEAGCAVGSVKSNIGHLEGAAGIAGLTKVLLQLKHGKLVPTINLEEANPKIDFASSSFAPQLSLADWPRPVLTVDGEERTFPRRAGVSSFGAGGANAHVIVEEYREPASRPEAPLAASQEEELFLLSARTPGQLAAFAARVAAFLADGGDEESSLRELAYSSQVGRREMGERLAIVARTRAELAQRLEAFADGLDDPNLFTGTAGGEGGGRLLGDEDGATFVDGLIRRRQLAKLARVWVMGVAVDWRRLWPQPKPRRAPFPTYPFERRRYWLAVDGPAGPLSEVPWQRRRAEWALVGDAFYLTDHKVRGARWVPGAAWLEIVREECGRGELGERFEIRNVRWPSSLDLDEGPARVEVALERHAAEIEFRITSPGPSPRVFARGTLASAEEGEPALLDPAAVLQRCPRPGAVETFYADLQRGGLDYGPAFRVVDELHLGKHEGLARLVLPSSLHPERQRFVLHPSLLDGALQTVSSLCPGSTAYLPAGFSRAAVYAPLTPRCWVHLREVVGAEGAGRLRRFDLLLANEEGRALLAVDGLEIVPSPVAATVCRYSRPCWQPEPPDDGGRLPRDLLVVTGDDELRAALAQRFAAAGSRSVFVLPGSGFIRRDDATYELVPGEREHARRLAGELAGAGRKPGGLVICPAGERESAALGALTAHLDHGLYTVLWLATAVLESKPEAPLRLVFSRPCRGPDFQPVYGAVAAALKALALEHSRLSAVHVAFESEEATASAAGMASRLADELARCDNGVAEIRYRADGRWRKRLETFEPPPARQVDELPLRPDGTYLITGGGGVLGLRFAAFLGRRGPLRLVLAGRSSLDEERRARIDALARDGVVVDYRRADLGRREEVERLMAEIRARHGNLHGILHAAGVTRDSLAVKKTRAEVEAVLGPKVFGTVHLDEATRHEPLDFFVCFSSVVAETGNLGQVDYAFANAFLNEFAALREERRRAGLRTGRTLSIGWPLWRESGITVDPATLRLLARRWRMVPMSTRSGLEAFDRALAAEESCVLVVEGPQQDETAAERTSPTAPVAGPKPAAARPPGVERELRRMVSGFLLVAEEEVDPDAELMELGFDSISLTELVNRVNETYGLDLLPTVLFECPTLTELARYLEAHHGPELATRRARGVESIAEQGGGEPVGEEPVAAAPALTAAVGEPSVAAWTATAVEPEAVRWSEPERSQRRQVAIIGMGGLMPQSEDLETFWRHLVAGHDLVVPVPEDREELRRHPLTREIRAGFLDRVDLFDARLFGISPREASLMDPQQRLFLETVWRTIEDAGYRPSSLAGSTTGLFVGVSTSDYDDLLKEHGVEVEAHTATGIAHSILANRISYLMDLRGPSEAVDTACSSSLVALHRAVRALEWGECEMAVAGGVNVILSPGLFTAFSQSGMLSPEGKCRTFDKDADGYVRGEGAGAVLLKPLDRAVADGDPIYAVIEGSAVNHGGRSSSLTAPNPEAQARVLVQAYREAGFDPDTVTYIEAHGTGTRLGDPIEVEGLKSAFTALYADRGEPLPNRPQIAIGSVKTNIGHLESAAGIAGLLKVLLAMKHGELPPSLHFQEVNPYVRLEGTPFRVNDSRRPWDGITDAAGRPVRRAGVSSFGFGGSNAHVVLEAYLPAARPERPAAAGPWLIVLSAPTGEALAAYAERLGRFLAGYPDLDLADLAFTLQVGREEMAERLAAVVTGREALIGALAAAARGQEAVGLYRGTVQRGRVAAASEDPHRLARLWVEGAVVDWQRLHTDPRPRRVSAPSFPFSRRRHWFDTPAPRPRSEGAAQPGEESPRRRRASRRRRGRPGPKVRLTPTGTAVPARHPAAAHAGEPAGGAPAAPPPRAEREAGVAAAAGATPPPPGTGRDPASTPAPPAPAPRAAPPSAAPATGAAVAEVVRERLSEILAIPAVEIGDDQSFADLGLDSIYRMDLVRLINAAFALDLKAVELYEHDTIEQLAGCVESVLARRGGGTAQASGGEPRGEPVPAEDGGSPAAAPAGEPSEAPRMQIGDQLGGLIRRLIGRPFDGQRTFADNGFTSFDMLKVIAALEKRLGALRKTLLFDHPTLDQLTAHLVDSHGPGALECLAEEAAEPTAPTVLRAAQTVPARPPAGADGPAAEDPPGVATGDGDAGPVVVARRRLGEQPGLARVVSELDQRHGKEGGLAGRDIAPLIFLGADRRGCFNFSQREDTLLAWSYVGTREGFPQLVGEWVDFARRRGLKVNLLSMIRLEEVAGRAFTATPFGAIQRLDDLERFSLEGGRMRRLRYMVRRFERAGNARTIEYASGSDPRLDGRIADLVDRWSRSKEMVNPYVSRVQEEIRRGRLEPRHRLFLTYLDDALVNVVIITRIPSEQGYLLDLEFYAEDMPLGGLELAIVRILDQLVGEGWQTFSFGASFGVKICDSANADPEVERALEELRSLDVFTGEGNFRFKNKFRPRNLPIYLCQPADSRPTDVVDVILMIANPTAPAARPPGRGELSHGNGKRPPRLTTKAPATDDRVARRERLLAEHGYNPLAIPRREVDFDLLTDSWAELEGRFIDQRLGELETRLAAGGRETDWPAGIPLPFTCVLPTSSGRSAEAALCRAWPRRNRLVAHNALFPTWTFSLLDHGLTPVAVPAEHDARAEVLFKGNVSLPALDKLLAEEAGRTAFVCIEVSNNAGGGYPISLANLRRVRELTSGHRVPLVLDATRILENAYFITAHEDGCQAQEVWDVVEEMLGLADSATLSLSKDFGIDFGGLVATNDPAVAHHLQERTDLRGREVSLRHRRLLALAAGDREKVAELVRQRMSRVRELWQRLADAGVPVLAPASGHCVLLDVPRIASLTGLRHPIPAFLAWLYRNTGIRAAPHLAGSDGGGALEDCIRLAVPVGLGREQVDEVGSRLAALFTDPGEVADLIAVDAASEAGSPGEAAYYPADRVPEDVRRAMDGGHRARNENLQVLREHNAAVERRIVTTPGGDVEVFAAGEGPTLLLVHPFNIGAGFFAPQFAALTDRYRLIAVHASGVGATTAAGDLSFDGLAHLAMEALRRIGVEGPIHVAGASFGGVTAQAFALEYLRETASLTLIGSSYKVGNRVGEMNRLSVVAKEDFDHLLHHTGSDRMRRQREHFENLLLRCESMDPQTGLLYLDEFAANPSLLPRLPELAVPTLIVHGRHDTVIQLKTAHLLHGTIPDVRYREIADAGHFPSLTHAEEFNRILSRFLGERCAPAARSQAGGEERPGSTTPGG